MSQENQKSLKDGSISTKVVDFRQQFLETKSSKTSDDPGLVICREFWYFLWSELDFPSRPIKDHKELWILVKYGPEVLKRHRCPLWDSGY